jgi:hypothetical protein
MSGTDRAEDFVPPEPLPQFSSFVPFQVAKHARQIGFGSMSTTGACRT